MGERRGANMKCFVVIFDGEGFEPVNKKVFLNYEDAKACLDEVIDEHEMLCAKGKWTSYAHRFEVVEFELVGEPQ
jgi:hypothetical protein